jgi:hypothetical protein
VNNSGGHNTTLHDYQDVTLLQIYDIVEKVKFKKSYKRKILAWLCYGGLVAVTMWLVTDMVLDYFSHIDADEPLFP